VIQPLKLEIAGDLRRDGAAAGEHVVEILIVHADLMGQRRGRKAFSFSWRLINLIISAFVMMVTWRIALTRCS
jgi:hypothetical protein